MLEVCVGKRKSRQLGGLKRHKFLAHISDGKAHLLYTALKGAGYHGWEDELEALPHRRPAVQSCQRDIAALVEYPNGSITFPVPQSEAVGTEAGRESGQDDKTPSYNVASLGGHTLV